MAGPRINRSAITGEGFVAILQSRTVVNCLHDIFTPILGQKKGAIAVVPELDNFRLAASVGVGRRSYLAVTNLDRKILDLKISITGRRQ